MVTAKSNITEDERSARSALLEAVRGSERLTRLVSQQLSDLDIWQKERAEWQQERLILRAMIDQVPDYLFVKDTQCRFVVANKAVAADLGQGPDGIIGKSDLELHPPELARDFYQVDQRVIAKGQPELDREEYVVLPTGEKRWLSTSKLPLRNEAGTIIGLVGIARDITRRKAAEDEVHYLAYHDQLTGLLNRASLEAELQGTGASSWSHLLLIDLDWFKQVNDTLGHRAGDSVLRQVASSIEEIVADLGKAFRIGGDEFAAVVSGFADPGELAEKIVTRFEAPLTVENTTVHIGACIGIARLKREDRSMDALRDADVALYECKKHGRGQWRMFRQPARREADRR